MPEPTWNFGHFTWRELMTPDVDTAKRFYGALFGWTFSDEDMGETIYTLIHRDGTEIGGMMADASGEGGGWMSSVSVPDVDGSVAAALRGGGKVMFGPATVPGVGRVASIADPAGAFLGLCRWDKGDTEPGPPLPGTFCWETLATPSVDAIAPFYREVTGWSVAADGPGGATVVHAGDAMVADVEAPRGGAPAHWATCVAVEDLDALLARVAELGGAVLVPPTPVPGTGTFALITDPSGAVLGLFA